MAASEAGTCARDPITILVLGQMEQRDQGAITADARTVHVKNILEKIATDLANEPTLQGQTIEVVSPEDRQAAVVIPGILDLIERSELMVIDMSQSRANVGYEAGIVHALGLPYVIITSDERPPFYFQGAEFIGHFHFARDYDPAQPTHRDLRRHVLQFATGARAAGYSDNQLTQYYGLPIVDVAGPSGLAAGYYRNAIRRFVRPGGFLDAPCTVVWTSGFEARDNVETRRTDRRSMAVGYFIAMRPEGGLTHSYSEHTGLLDRALERLGLRLQFATIQKRAQEFEDMRDFGGQFLARTGAPSDPVSFIEPAVVVDTPTTLYALQFSPRVRKLNKLTGPVPRPSLENRRRRLLQQMQASFERNLDYQLQQEMDPARTRRFRLIDLGDLPSVLREIGAL